VCVATLLCMPFIVKPNVDLRCIDSLGSFFDLYILCIISSHHVYNKSWEIEIVKYLFTLQIVVALMHEH